MLAMFQVVAFLLGDDELLFLYGRTLLRVPTLFLTDTQFLLFHTGANKTKHCFQVSKTELDMASFIFLYSPFVFHSLFSTSKPQ